MKKSPCKSGIYFIRNVLNHKIYVGSSVNLEKRKKRHFYDLKRNTHNNIHLQRAYNKIGEKYFIFEIVELIEGVEELRAKEQLYIDSYKNKSYNIGTKSCGGDNISLHPMKQDIICKMKSSLKIRYSSLSSYDRKVIYGKKGTLNGMFGKKHTEYSKSLISCKNKGKKCYKQGKTHIEYFGKERAEIISEKMSVVASQRIGKNNPFFGKKHSIETKKILSDIAKSKIPKKGKDLSYTKTYKITLPNDEIIFAIGLLDVAKRFKISTTAVSNAVRNNRIIMSKKSPMYLHKIETV